ncbi:hypothetical protein Q7P35_003972 [Cladosporium inversicolor]
MDNTGPSNDDSMPGIGQQAQCGLFRLPQELHNMIYRHIFGTGLVERPIDLRNAQVLAPKSFLTLTCRRVHDEASPIHQATSAKYWANDVFKFAYTDVYDQPVLNNKQIEHMTCIMRHRALEDSSYEMRELRSDTSSGYWALACQQSSPRSSIDSGTSYQITAQYRNGGAWRSVRVFSSKTGRWSRTLT